MFNPGDKVIKRTEKDADKWGTVMNFVSAQRKPGYIAVMFQRHVWIKPENLMLLSDWKAKHPQKPRDIKNFWLHG
jgi:hypothetical protein